MYCTLYINCSRTIPGQHVAIQGTSVLHSHSQFSLGLLHVQPPHLEVIGRGVVDHHGGLVTRNIFHLRFIGHWAGCGRRGESGRSFILCGRHCGPLAPKEGLQSERGVCKSLEAGINSGVIGPPQSGGKRGRDRDGGHDVNSGFGQTSSTRVPDDRDSLFIRADVFDPSRGPFTAGGWLGRVRGERGRGDLIQRRERGGSDVIGWEGRKRGSGDWGRKIGSKRFHPKFRVVCGTE